MQINIDEFSLMVGIIIVVVGWLIYYFFTKYNKMKQKIKERGLKI